MTLRHVTDPDHRRYMIATGVDRLDVLDRFNLTGVLTVDGIRRVRDWTVTADLDLRYGRLVVEPELVTLRIRDLGDLELLLTAANARAQARRFLRAKVLEVAHNAGLPLRPFARPA